MNKLIFALLIFTTLETLEMNDLTLTTDSSSSDTSQRIYVVMSNGSSLFEEFEEALSN